MVICSFDKNSPRISALRSTNGSMRLHLEEQDVLIIQTCGRMRQVYTETRYGTGDVGLNIQYPISRIM
jgi:hypothetical protein